MQTKFSPEFIQSQCLSKQFQDRFWSYVHKTDSCWIWNGGKSSYRYGGINLFGGHNQIKAHIASWIIHNGLVPDGMCVCHTCDVPACVNPAHLWVGTHADNMRDMAAKKRSKGLKGELHKMVKLTESQVLDIRNRYSKSAKNGQALANEFGINRSQVYKIVLRQLWNHI